MTTRTHLGKISSVSIGHNGYQGCQMGIQFCFRFDGNSGISDFWGFWGADIEHSESCKWSESDRIQYLGETMMRISKLLVEAKKRDVSELKDVPVEITTINSRLKSWRILTEVI